MDLKVDQHGEVVMDGGSPALVRETEMFEQLLMLFLQSYMYEHIGATDNMSNVLAKLELQARKVAVQFDLVDSVHEFNAVKVGPRSVELFIDYDTNREEMSQIMLGPGPFSSDLDGTGEVFR